MEYSFEDVRLGQNVTNLQLNGFVYAWRSATSVWPHGERERCDDVLTVRDSERR
ncbi:hypothetical protein Csa_006314 [Cucumis sativus]|uniref:Uncharacterized protein n=1 Tax=Cucumis sativus TaxID=3659 RepID=A0A0A0LH05_CUCSA|nr:hypothetical protein Csa_006314 [Cucumis sativus]